MNRIMNSAFGILLTTSLLVGCSSGPATNNAPGDQANKKQDPVTIKFSFWGNKEEIDLKQQLIAKFQETHSDIKVDGTYTDGATYPTKLQTFFSSNTAPDVISIAGDIQSDFVAKDVFEDLTPFMKKDNLLTNTWNEKFIDVFRNKGKITAAPFVYKIHGVIYNKDLFDKAKLPYPNDQWTEDDFVNTAKKLNEPANKIWGVNLGGYPNNATRFLHGNPVYDVEKNTVNAENNEQFKHTFQLFTGLIKDKIAPDAADVQAAGGGFETGKFGMAITAPFEMANFQKLIGNKFKWDIVQLPQNSKFGPWKTHIYADGISIAKSSKHKDQAWEFVKYLTTNPDMQTKISDIGIPALLSVANGKDYLTTFPSGWTPYNKKVFVDMLSRGIPWNTTGVWAKVNDEIKKQYQAVIQGQTTVEEAAKTIQKKGTEYLSTQK